MKSVKIRVLLTTLIMVLVCSYAPVGVRAQAAPEACPKHSTLGPLSYIVGLKKVEIAVGYKDSGFSDPQIPTFLKDHDSLSEFVLHEVKRVLGRCVGGEENIELAANGIITNRELPGVLSLTLIGYVERDKNVRPGKDTYYAVFWTKVYRPDQHEWNKNPPYSYENFPGVIFLNQSKESVQERFLILLDQAIM